MFRSTRLNDLNRLRLAGRALRAGRPASGIRNVITLARSAGTGVRLAWRTLAWHRSYNPDELGIAVQAQLEQIPSPESRITLSDERDRLGLRRARIDWRVGECELETAARFAELCKAGFEDAALADVVVDPAIERRDRTALARFNDQLHHMGTARMSTSPDTGVVDRDLRVFGTRNLFICSAAVFPTSGYANPTHTILALALRLADRLCERDTRG